MTENIWLTWHLLLSFTAVHQPESQLLLAGIRSQIATSRLISVIVFKAQAQFLPDFSILGFLILYIP